MCLVIATIATTTFAGEIQLAWDPTSGASGYKVYYGTSSGAYGSPVVVYGTSTTIQGLQDCVSYYVAVKAFNAAGESPNYSNELAGWSRPSIASATPAVAIQGEQLVIDVMGANFQSGAVVDLGNPHVLLSSVTALSCNHIQLLATVEPTAEGMRPAHIGRLDLTIENPDSVFGMKPQAFEVLINPARFDINKSDSMTTDRIDGKDTVYLSRQFGLNESNPNYDPNDDFDGDGWVDGQDLAYVASNLGRCWSASTKTWRLDACPTVLQ
jgi:hypothetical protein